MKICLTIFHILFFLLISCRQQPNISSSESKMCFCDSVYDNTRTDTIKEFLCYKGNKVYKLQKQKKYQSLSRHSLNDNRWCFEYLKATLDGKIMKNQFQNFLKTETINDSIELIFVLNSVDSIRAIIEHEKDTIISKSVLNNKVKFHKKVFKDSLNFIKLYGYTHDSLPHPDTGILDIVRTQHSIMYKASYIIKYPMDIVLKEFNLCIDSNKKNGY